MPAISYQCTYPAGHVQQLGALVGALVAALVVASASVVGALVAGLAVGALVVTGADVDFTHAHLSVGSGE